MDYTGRHSQYRKTRDDTTGYRRTHRREASHRQTEGAVTQSIKAPVLQRIKTDTSHSDRTAHTGVLTHREATFHYRDIATTTILGKIAPSRGAKTMPILTINPQAARES